VIKTCRIFINSVQALFTKLSSVIVSFVKISLGSHTFLTGENAFLPATPIFLKTIWVELDMEDHVMQVSFVKTGLAKGQ
jgi:hypothetical protein